MYMILTSRSLSPPPRGQHSSRNTQLPSPISTTSHLSTTRRHYSTTRRHYSTTRRYYSTLLLDYSTPLLDYSTPLLDYSTLLLDYSTLLLDATTRLLDATTRLLDATQLLGETESVCRIMRCGERLASPSSSSCLLSPPFATPLPEADVSGITDTCIKIHSGSLLLQSCMGKAV
jgi:hypothetical protein